MGSCRYVGLFCSRSFVGFPTERDDYKDDSAAAAAAGDGSFSTQYSCCCTLPVYILESNRCHGSRYGWF